MYKTIDANGDVSNANVEYDAVLDDHSSLFVMDLLLDLLDHMQLSHTKSTLLAELGLTRFGSSLKKGYSPRPTNELVMSFPTHPLDDVKGKMQKSALVQILAKSQASTKDSGSSQRNSSSASVKSGYSSSMSSHSVLAVNPHSNHLNNPGHHYPSSSNLQPQNFNSQASSALLSFQKGRALASVSQSSSQSMQNSSSPSRNNNTHTSTSAQQNQQHSYRPPTTTRSIQSTDSVSLSLLLPSPHRSAAPVPANNIRSAVDFAMENTTSSLRSVSHSVSSSIMSRNYDTKYPTRLLVDNDKMSDVSSPTSSPRPYYQKQNHTHQVFQRPRDDLSMTSSLTSLSQICDFTEPVL